MKRIISILTVVAVVLFAGYNVYKAQQREVLSDIAMENVEALAEGEWQDGDKIDCWTFIVSPTPEELDLTKHPIVVSCSPCGNLVVAEWISGLDKCTYYKF